MNEFLKPLFFEPLEIIALVAKGRISTNFTLITLLLQSTALLQSLHVHWCDRNISEKAAEDNRRRQQKRTVDRRKAAEQKVVYN